MAFWPKLKSVEFVRFLNKIFKGQIQSSLARLVMESNQSLYPRYIKLDELNL